MQRHLKLIHDIAHGKPAHLRSPKWHQVEREHLAKESECQRCGATVRLQVHHIVPFHLHPEMELEPFNLITLCEEAGYLNCHLVHGHNGDWKDFNKNVREECEEHRRGPEWALLKAIRAQDPDLFKWIVTGKQRGHAAMGDGATARIEMKPEARSRKQE
jgi:hypothetical protein